MAAHVRAAIAAEVPLLKELNHVVLEVAVHAAGEAEPKLSKCEEEREEEEERGLNGIEGQKLNAKKRKLDEKGRGKEGEWKHLGTRLRLTGQARVYRLINVAQAKSASAEHNNE